MMAGEGEGVRMDGKVVVWTAVVQRVLGVGSLIR